MENLTLGYVFLQALQSPSLILRSLMLRVHSSVECTLEIAQLLRPDLSRFVIFAENVLKISWVIFSLFTKLV